MAQERMAEEEEIVLLFQELTDTQRKDILSIIHQRKGTIRSLTCQQESEESFSLFPARVSATP